ncbi:thioredoxin domain-containing protein [Carboxylicivirga sp. N1Y90]|uniref:thioredoxin domain-containing protein n=1 Tax=Carboxylicivirga fragile TaxID=3417571 RepID=UPI003D33DBE8|nr:thioredoxin domain-containing protein [Marinilabiliaceae bacterium N1Y90]
MNSNKLIAETSPYLLQHAHNPVHWYAWGEEAFERARNEDKLILISVGYSACHWCHVMEHESFEDEEVANLMNAHFICVKVDREERPDVDQIYMEAVQILTGRGGWPLNCFALPDGRPVWGGTYFPKNQWLEVLTSLSALYTNEREKLLDQAKQLTKGIRSNDFPNIVTTVPSIDEELIISNTKVRFDNTYGGYGGAPKFPMPVSLNLAHQLGVLKGDEELMDFVCLTLDKMASGGIYDQAGGGFSRYSVDERWFAPHFEKMLYDNAQLLSLYSNAYKTSGKKLYERIVEETFQFLQRELQSPEGAFYSALDADSEGVEGKFYTWTRSELKEILGEDEHFFKYFEISDGGNWEHGVNILHGSITREEYAANNNLDFPAFQTNLQASLDKLLEVRKGRVRPGLDDKILTAWNALTITGLCDAYQAFGDDKYKQAAERAMQYLLKVVKQDDGRLLRTSKSGVAKIDAFLDDYALMIEAFLSLYQITFNTDYYIEALALNKLVLRDFYDESKGVIYYTSDKGEQLIARKTDAQDNVIPSSMATMAKNLMQLSQLGEHSEFRDIAQMLIAKMYEQAEKNPSYYARWALLSVLDNQHLQEIAILGTDVDSYRKQLQKRLIPGVVYAGSVSDNDQIFLLKDRYVKGQTLIYKCENKVCELPITSPEVFHPSK